MATPKEIIDAIDALMLSELANGATLATLSDRKIGNFEIKKGTAFSNLLKMREYYNKLVLAYDGGCELETIAFDIRDLGYSNDGS